ncbi:substrate-binding domain-containing protein [Escherichia coli]|nr:substrate-binding domain-containing protein [Escherichia coli]
MPYLLEMKNITKTFGSVKAIDNVSLRLNAGEIVSLCGENGSGKSTLMKVLCGIYPHGSYEGEIIFAGEEIQASHIRDTERKGIAIIHQELALVKELTVLENIFLGNEITHNGIMDYDRQVVEGVGEYLQASQSEWDIFIEEDFRARIDKIKDWLGDGVIADFDDKQIEQALADVDVPIVGVGGSYHLAESYPPVHYIATDNYALVESAFLHLKEKGVNRFAFYGLPESSGKRWATEREYAFRQLVAEEKYRGVVYQGLETAPENWQHAQNRLADWLQTLPPQTGIIAVTDARARHILQVCEHLHIPVPEKLCVIGIDNEELTRYLSRVALSSVAQGARQMGYQAAKLLHRLLDKEEMPLQRILVPPVRVIERRSTDYRSLTDPAVIQAMHYIRNHACKGIKVDQVLDAVGISRSNLEKRFKEEVGETIHAMIHAEKLEKARSLLISTTLSINEISQMCGYPSLQYFYSVFKKAYDTTPKEYRDVNSEVML